MAWTTPRTWVTSEVVTAAILNTHIRDNLNAIAPGSQSMLLVWSSGDTVLETKTGQGRLIIPFNATIVGVQATCGVAPTGQSVIVDVNLDGTSIYTTQANRPTIAASANDSTQTTPDTTAVTSGDVMTVDIDQVGSGDAGENLTVIVEYTAP